MSPAERIAAVLAPVERPLLREYSVKAIGDALREGRFLVSFPRGALGPGPSRVLRGMLDELGAPAELLADGPVLAEHLVPRHTVFLV